MSQPQSKKKSPEQTSRVAVQFAHLVWVAAEVAEIKQWAIVVAKQAELNPIVAEHQRLNDIRVKAREAMTALL